MTSTSNPSYVIGAVPAPKRTVTVLNGGANRGARENLRAFAEFNRDSTRTAIVPVYVDPLGGRAFAMKEEAERQGVAARAVESRLEDIVDAEGTEDTSPLQLFNLDRASAIAHVLRATEATHRATLGYLLLKLPSGRLWAVRFVLEPHDQLARENAIAFFERLAAVSERSSSGAILGESADPAHVLAEPAIRRWFADHTKLNLVKILSGIEPATNAFEVTMNGSETLQLVIAVRNEWTDPPALAEQIVANPSAPLRRGTRFLLAEVAPDGIRFHDVRRRTDDRVTVGSAEVVDRDAVDTKVRSDEANRVAAEALAKATRETLSRRNPVTTTD